MVNVSAMEVIKYMHCFFIVNKQLANQLAILGPSLQRQNCHTDDVISRRRTPGLPCSLDTSYTYTAFRRIGKYNTNLLGVSCQTCESRGHTAQRRVNQTVSEKLVTSRKRKSRLYLIGSVGFCELRINNRFCLSSQRCSLNTQQANCIFFKYASFQAEKVYFFKVISTNLMTEKNTLFHIIKSQQR